MLKKEVLNLTETRRQRIILKLKAPAPVYAWTNTTAVLTYYHSRLNENKSINSWEEWSENSDDLVDDKNDNEKSNE